MSQPVSQDENAEKITIKKSTYTGIIVGVIIAVAAATFFAGFLLGSSTPQTNSEYITKSDIEDIVTKLESKLEGVKTPTPAVEPTAPPAPVMIKIPQGDDPMKGNPSAPITIVEFSDFQCPFCARFYQDTLSQLEENYINNGKAKLIYRDLPLESIHKNAKSAALAAQCANEQDKFWDFHNKLFDGQTEWQNQSADQIATTFVSYAADLKIDPKKFESCYTSAKYSDGIQKDQAEAARYGATGTPTFFIGNENDGFIKLVGAQPFFSFENTIRTLDR